MQEHDTSFRTCLLHMSTPLFQHPARHSINEWALLILTVVLTATATANEGIEQEEIEEIVVQGKYLSIDHLNAVKTLTPILEVPQSVSILTSTQIENQAFRNFGAVLRYTPGLSSSQGEGHRDAIIIRGIQTTADFFLDGLRDDTQYYRPLYNVQQIEILRGPNALLFGRGGGGGVINRVTKKPDTAEPFNKVQLGTDTFGVHSISSDNNITVTDKTAFRINTYYHAHANHRDFYNGNSFAINPTVQVEFTPASTGIFSYEYVDDDRVVDRGVPSQNLDGAVNAPLEGFDNTFFGSPNANRTTLQAHFLRARFAHDFSESLRGTISAQFADYEKLYQNLYPSNAVTLVSGIFDNVQLDGYRDTTQRQNLIVQANLVGEANTGAVTHTLLIGAEFGSQDTQNARHDNVFEANDGDKMAIPFFDPLNIPSFSFTNPVRNRRSEVLFQSLYAQDQLDLSKFFKLVLGLRYDAFNIDVSDIHNAAVFGRLDQKITPRIGTIYKPQDSIAIYISASETFLPQSGDQFLTLNLDTQSTKPQVFDNLELGLKWDIRPDLTLTTALFDLRRKSFTSVDPEDAAQTLLVEGSQTTGFEAQLAGQLNDRWSLRTGYTYLDARIVRIDGSGDNGNRARQTPENMLSVWSSYRISNNLELSLGMTHQDSFFALEDNSVQIPSFTRVDAAFFYHLNASIKLQLNLENLLDASYFPDAHNNNNISTGAPFNVRFSSTIHF